MLTFLQVNPIAIRKPVDVYTENKRKVTVLEKTVFGSVLYIIFKY